MAITVGHIIASTDYGFFMVMNNLERLYSVSIGIFLSKIILILKVFFTDNNADIKLISIMLAVGFVPIIICTWFYRKATGNEHFKSGKKPHFRDYTVLILACFVFLFNDFLAPALWRSITVISSLTLNSYYVIGVFLGIVLTLILHLVLHCNICYVLNFSFAILTMGFVIHVFKYNSVGWILLQVLLFGISYAMSFISIYYMMGIIAKRLQSVLFFRIGIFSVAIFYILGSCIASLIKDINSRSVLSVISVLSIAVMLVIFSLTPLLTKILYTSEWIDDLYRTDVTHVSRLTAQLMEFKLSPREIEVCVLLLDGYTIRQISAMLNIAYSTVNTYYSSIYRKLGVNSRTELIVMFSEYSSK